MEGGVSLRGLKYSLRWVLFTRYNPKARDKWDGVLGDVRSIPELVREVKEVAIRQFNKGQPLGDECIVVNQDGYPFSPAYFLYMYDCLLRGKSLVIRVKPHGKISRAEHKALMSAANKAMMCAPTQGDTLLDGDGGRESKVSGVSAEALRQYGLPSLLWEETYSSVTALLQRIEQETGMIWEQKLIGRYKVVSCMCHCVNVKYTQSKKGVVLGAFMSKPKDHVKHIDYIHREDCPSRTDYAGVVGRVYPVPVPDYLANGSYIDDEYGRFGKTVVYVGVVGPGRLMFYHCQPHTVSIVTYPVQSNQRDTWSHAETETVPVPDGWTPYEGQAVVAHGGMAYVVMKERYHVLGKPAPAGERGVTIPRIFTLCLATLEWGRLPECPYPYPRVLDGDCERVRLFILEGDLFQIEYNSRHRERVGMCHRYSQETQTWTDTHFPTTLYGWLPVVIDDTAYFMVGRNLYTYRTADGWQGREVDWEGHEVDPEQYSIVAVGRTLVMVYFKSDREKRREYEQLERGEEVSAPFSTPTVVYDTVSGSVTHGSVVPAFQCSPCTMPSYGGVHMVWGFPEGEVDGYSFHTIRFDQTRYEFQ
ncbi:hypothetical protein KIPB_004208 [Kipferlia bialata]|uniref:Uncharacterized protein n=1 Tax=Kipferlia bialata TaxID=797122 RepID=A0A9K3CVB6_9EUKA|nr:hypothetical protein KIPB_004208 [Kipferlia bialata]|eukprot:g4208.t1